MAVTQHDVRLGEVYYRYLLELARDKVGSTIRYGALVARAKRDFPDDDIVKSAIPISIGKRLLMIEEFCTGHGYPNLACLAVNAKGRPGIRYTNNWAEEMAAVAAFVWTSVEAEWGIHVEGWRLAAAAAPKLVTQTRADAEAAFVAHWRADLLATPPRYPKRIENAPKEAIIRMIEKGHDPADAFTAELFPDEEN